MNLITHRQSMRVYVKFLIDHEIPHSVTYTNRTFKVVSRLGTRVFTSGEISRRGLGFMQTVYSKVKLTISDLDHFKADYNKLGLQRNFFSKKLQPGKVTGIIEVDMNKAYWTAAYKLGVITEEIYNNGLTNGYKKVELLACLGGLAKDKRTRHFDGKRYGKSVVVTDSKETRFLWDAISFEIDKSMQECAKSLGDAFYFYWTDAIFMKHTVDNVINVQRILKKHEFECKTVELEYMINDMENRRTTVFSKENKSHAKNPIRDEHGNYGRVFTHLSIKDKKELVDKIKSFMNRDRIVNKVKSNFIN